MKHLPEKLQNEEFRFVKIQKGKKYPYEKKWQSESNYKYNDSEFIDHINNGGNYGVVCGYGDLVVIDCDMNKVTKAVRKELPDTFEIETGSGGAHFYYICKDIEKPIRMAEEKQGDLGDVQYKGKQVVGPGSLHPSGNHYKLKNNDDIKEVSIEDIRSALSEFIKDEHIYRNRENNKEKLKDKGYEELDIRDVVNTTGLKDRSGELQGSHPLHGSNTGQNFCVNPSKNVWHCFRHDTGGGPLSWIAVKEGIISCSDATHGALDGDKFKKVLKVAEEKYGLEIKNTLEDNLNDRLKEVLNEERYHWNGNTKFVTFIRDLKISADKEINKLETLELPKKLADDLIDNNIAKEKIWFCTECKEKIYEDSRPYSCPYCGNNKKKAIKALHPNSPHDIGDVLLKNYNFATVRESIDASSEGRIHIYTGGVYRTEGCKGFIRHKVKMMNHTSKQNFQRDVIHHIATLSDIPESQFGLGKGKTVVSNGILDLESMEIKPHHPKYYAVTEMDVEYDPDVECPKFKKYLKEDIPSKKDRKLLQEFLGTALVNEKMHKKGMIVVGPTDSGKSTLIRIISRVFGRMNVSAQDPHNLTDSRWATAKLRKVLLNTTDEVQSKKLKNLALLKKIMDGNEIYAERKGENTFEFKPTCEHLFAANQTPSAARKDEAFWNRWIVIEMPHTLDNEEIDEDLPDKILEEKSGILNWMIEGYKDFMENDKKFTYQQHWEEARDRWLNWGDSIQRFIQNRIEYSEGDKISASELHRLYTEYANDNNMDAEGQKKLTTVVKGLNYAYYSANLSINGKKQRGFKNIRVVTDKEREKKEEKKKATLKNFDDDKQEMLSCYPAHNEKPISYLEIEERAKKKGIEPEKFNEYHEKWEEADGLIHQQKPGKYKRL